MIEKNLSHLCIFLLPNEDKFSPGKGLIGGCQNLTTKTIKIISDYQYENNQSTTYVFF